LNNQMTSPKKAILARRLRKETQKRAQIQRELIRREAALGGQLFGEVPEGVKREFVCVNRTTWMWHEESAGNNGQIISSTTRYDVREGGVIYKLQPGQPYEKVSEQEAANLRNAAMLYNKAVRQHLYNAN
jgi:hypothetical protein